VQPLLQWKSNKYYIFWVCVCSLRYPAFNAHAPCCYLWPVRLCNSLINSKIFGGEGGLSSIKFVFWISPQLLSETFLILKRIQRDIIINIHRSSCIVPLFLPDFNEDGIFSADFRKMLKYQMSWKSVQWEPSCSMRMGKRTYKHDDANSSFFFFFFCERA
jgi:hypothetical protein